MDTQPPAKPVAVTALEAAPRTPHSGYPEPYYTMMRKRERRVLGDLFGLSNFGVNIVSIRPGGQSALRHWHLRQDEFIYVISGHPILVTDAGETQLAPGMCAGFKAGDGNGHMLINCTDEDAVCLEVGDRMPGDAVTYPDDDLRADFVDGKWAFLHKDGTAYS